MIIEEIKHLENCNTKANIENDRLSTENTQLNKKYEIICAHKENTINASNTIQSQLSKIELSLSMLHGILQKLNTRNTQFRSSIDIDQNYLYGLKKIVISYTSRDELESTKRERSMSEMGKRKSIGYQYNLKKNTDYVQSAQKQVSEFNATLNILRDKRNSMYQELNGCHKHTNTISNANKPQGIKNVAFMYKRNPSLKLYHANNTLSQTARLGSFKI